MNNRSWFCREAALRRIDPHRLRSLCPCLLALGLIVFAAVPAAGGNAPAWMHALTAVPLPAHDEKTDAVLLYSETFLTVQSSGKMKELTRYAYKVLRPGGKSFGTVSIPFDAETRITSLHGWCIPAQGNDYEVKDKDSLETSLSGVEFSELVSDVRLKVLLIPAADPGSIVGYEVEQEVRPYILQDEWRFQHKVPSREAHYSLRLPSGWEFKVTWLNHPEAAPAASGSGQWDWAVSDIPGIKTEEDMPPWQGVAGRMIVSLLPPGDAQNKGFVNWEEVGAWYQGLIAGRRDPSPEIKQKTAAVTAAAGSQLARMQAIARFMQTDIRYVAIELGIGGHQPHPAVDVFNKRFGDCKDKATLMSSMLKEVGTESFYVLINTDRGIVTQSSPPFPEFNHAILAIQLPADLYDASLVAVLQHPKLGKILFFDPTDEMTPFGMISGSLQANTGMLVAPGASGLVDLPRLAPDLNAIRRTAKLALQADGTLQGSVQEVRLGDAAERQRSALRSASHSADQIKPIESLLAGSLPTYRITDAKVTNLNQISLPFQFDYSFVAEHYAKSAGGLLLVRPRVIGHKSDPLLETKEPRRYPVEFEGPQRDTDVFEITIPAGYTVDELPPPVDADFGFAAYHSKSEVKGNVLRYTRTFEVKEVSVPLAKVNDLKQFYRIIAGDERNAAVLAPAAH